MRQIRYWLRLLSTFWSRFRKLILSGVILGLLLFIILPRLQFLTAFFSPAYSIGITGRFPPEEIPLEIQKEISMGLTALTFEGEPAPALANEWHDEEEGRVWIFSLGDFRWQDGTMVKAGDINYNFADVSQEVLDERTLKFVLKDPFAPFPTVVSKPVFKRGFLGTGSWKVTKLSLAGGRFVEAIKLANLKTGEKKTYRFYPSEETARTAFKLGEVNKLRDIVSARELADWPNLEVRQILHTDRYLGIFINTLSPPLSEKNLRQALAYAINKEAFGKQRAISPISPTSWVYNPQVKPYEYNPARAKELLGTLSKEEQEELSITLVTTPSLLSVTDQVKKYWEEVGIKTQVQVANTPPADFQTLVAIQLTPPDPDQYSLWHSTQGTTNITNYGEAEENKPRESQRIDKLLEDGRRTLFSEERKKIYLDFQRFVVEDSPVIFLYHPSTYTITRK